ADVDAARAADQARKRGVDHCRIEQMLGRDDVDIIHIAAPPATHAELAMRALHAGKHVLCEKPLATTVADGQKLVALAAAERRVLGVNLIMRYDPLCQAVERIVRDKL